ncbi:MAG: hypothetical protein IKR48_07060 [Kiritimatiellae bacterium]|nr:hypothetical protein [Kiritimatiellia bacterium]
MKRITMIGMAVITATVALGRSAELRAEDMNLLTNYCFLDVHGFGGRKGIESFMRRRGVSPDELVDELAEIIDSLKREATSTNIIGYIRSNALLAMSETDSPRALEYLKNAALTETGVFAWNAVNGIFRIEGVPKKSSDFLITNLWKPMADGDMYRRTVYIWLNKELSHSNPTPERKAEILTFIRNATLKERKYAHLLDEILCREDPDYAESKERAETLRKLSEKQQ